MSKNHGKIRFLIKSWLVVDADFLGDEDEFEDMKILKKRITPFR